MASSPTETPQSSSTRDVRLTKLQRESRAFQQKFRSLLESEDGKPSKPNLEFARKELRNVYLKLLFHYTFNARTRGIEGSIWIETTHPLVQLYRDQLTAIESRIRNLKKTLSEIERESNAGPATKGRSSTAQHGKKKGQEQQLAQLAQVYIKQANAFRSYLAAEEAFWRDLATRVVTLFEIEEALPNLKALDMLHMDNSNSATGMERIIGVIDVGVDEQIQARMPANRQRLIEIVHKALICCGDLARYRELYRDEGNDDSNTTSPSSNRGGRGGRGARGGGRGGRGGGRGGHHENSRETSLDPKRPRDFSRAANCYEQARHLVPSNGNPWNQLAVLAAYKDESFSSIHHYYRALCVSEPFEKAKMNLEKTLKKAIERWEEKGNLSQYTIDDNRSSTVADDEHSHATLNSSRALQDLVILHGAYFNRKKSIIFSRFPQHCIVNVSALLSKKALHTDEIVQMVITTIAALWLRRLWRGNDPISKEEMQMSTTSIVAEQSILIHFCNLSCVLFEIGAKETNEAIANAQAHPPSGPKGNNGHNVPTARQITAILRRMLPAVRIISKWLKIHMNYVQRCRQQSSLNQSASVSANAESMDSDFSLKANSQLATGLDELWIKYVHFINVVRFAFPFESLPSLGTSIGQSGMNGLDFEEDRDLRGFTPMKNASLTEVPSHLTSTVPPTGLLDISKSSNLHPNEEHLIRIADILIDAKVISETELSPVHFDDVKNVFYFVQGDAATQDREHVQNHDLIEEEVSEQVYEATGDQSFTRPFSDDEWRNASESSEDAVDLAMRAVDERTRIFGENGDPDASKDYDFGANDDEDEIILIPSQERSEIKLKPAIQMDTTNSLAAKDIERSSNNETPESQTAQHLLLQVLNGTSGTRMQQSTPPIGTNQTARLTASPSNQPGFGAIGSAIPARSDSSPLGAAAAWNNAGLQSSVHHRNDIWAPPISPHPTLNTFPTSISFNQLGQQQQSRPQNLQQFDPSLGGNWSNATNMSDIPGAMQSNGQDWNIASFNSAAPGHGATHRDSTPSGKW